MKILLIGAGNMGSALYRVWSSKYDVLVVENSKESQSDLMSRFKDIKFASDTNCEDMVVVLAVKPQSIASVNLTGRAKAVISIMAGVALDTIRSRFEADSFVRAMPNMAAQFAASATALTGDKEAKDLSLELFGSVGTAIWLATEKELNIATALAGSGPGYLAVVAEAMANSAVKLGLNSNDAHALTKALFGGMEPLLNSAHPAILKEKISSPAGTTAAGIAKLEEYGTRHAFYEAVKAAYERALELANNK